MKELSLHILDLVQNSTRAEASQVNISIVEAPQYDTYTLVIRDNGKGMDAETVKRVTDPFYTTRTTRKVGLGLSLMKQNAMLTGGDLTVESQPGEGTKLNILMGFSHLDRPPAGKLPEVLYMLMAGNPNVRFVYEHQTPYGKFTADSDEILEMLEGLPLHLPEIRKGLTEYLSNGLESIQAEFQP